MECTTDYDILAEIQEIPSGKWDTWTTPKDELREYFLKVGNLQFALSPTKLQMADGEKRYTIHHPSCRPIFKEIARHWNNVERRKRELALNPFLETLKEYNNGQKEKEGQESQS